VSVVSGGRWLVRDWGVAVQETALRMGEVAFRLSLVFCFGFNAPCLSLMLVRRDGRRERESHSLSYYTLILARRIDTL